MEVKMSRKQNTKKGVAAIYVVVFTTMLIGIITLSFLRIMLSESGRTLNDTLSDSAYNAALAGVEDAKYVIAKYQQDIASGTSSTIVDVVENHAENNCDVISDALGLPSGSEQGIGTDDASATFQDQAYTCVMIDLSGDFKGTLSSSNPTLVVPLKPSGKGDDNVNKVDGVQITWTMGGDEESGSSSFNGSGLKSLKENGLSDKVNNSEAIAHPLENWDDTDKNAVLGKKGIKDNGSPSLLNGLRVMLVQSPAGVSNPDYYASEGGLTNRGTLMLLASNDADSKKEFAASEFVDSADKNLNAPIRVKCESDSCTATLRFPRPKGGDNYSRNADNFFLVLNQLYSEPSIKVTVNMINSAGNIIEFFNVQPIVDATGRSGDLFRRVEARIGTDNGASLVPTAELSTNSAINKNFFVTKNCIDGTEECK